MPTYEYQCEKCGPFEIWQSIKDNALSACPTCGSKVQRLISANVGFVFKGSGFYQNDFKTQPTTKPEAKPAADPAPGPSTGSTGSPLGASEQSCGACGSPDPCPSGN
jgi:putative FmdB family regulatory protein